jgi:hypothetical protein
MTSCPGGADGLGERGAGPGDHDAASSTDGTCGARGNGDRSPTATVLLGIRVALAVVIPPSSVAVPADLADDLASAALGCTALSRARKLAAWVGSGKELTSSEVLRPAVAVEACRMLGIELPGARLRSALDADELMRDWTVALDAEFIVVDGRKAYAAPGVSTRPEAMPVLIGWLNAAAWAVGVADEPCAGCITVLHELSMSDRPRSLEELAEAVAATEPDGADGEPCPDCGGVHDADVLLGVGGLIGVGDPDEPDPRAHAEDTVRALVAFGAAASAEAAAFPDDRSGNDGAVQLTALGSILARVVFEGRAAMPDADAETVMSAVSDVPPRVARTLARPWLEARSPESAARELLAWAESADGEQRLAALAFAGELGPDAASAWREWAERPGFGAYARRWLADQGEPITEDPADEAWLTVEALNIMLDALPDMLPPSVLAEVFQQETETDVAEALSLLRGSGHPAAASIVASLTGQPTAMSSMPGATAGAKDSDSLAPAGTRGGVYQLKISLRGVSKPPVWRRVAVSPDITLAELHEVILRAMGWHGGHMHVFSTGWAEYGTPGPDLGHFDDSAVRLENVLVLPGSRLRYTYDFGDDWEHDIQLEDIRREEPESSYPSCLAGKGACPPEDCGGAWGYAELKDILADPADEQHQEMLEWLGLDSGEEFDPKEFSIDQVNARLRHLRADL